MSHEYLYVPMWNNDGVKKTFRRAQQLTSRGSASLAGGVGRRDMVIKHSNKYVYKLFKVNIMTDTLSVLR